MSQLTSSRRLLSVSTPLTETTLYIHCQSVIQNNIPWDNCRGGGGALLSVNMSPSVECKSPGAIRKRGATVFEYDQLFSPGLLLSAVVTFYLPFTQFTCQTDSCSAAAPSVGERGEVDAGWLSDLANGAAAKLHKLW